MGGLCMITSTNKYGLNTVGAVHYLLLGHSTFDGAMIQCQLVITNKRWSSNG